MKTIWVMILLLLTGTIHCVTRTVAIDGSEQYTSIQSAINASANGDTVLVYPGRYFENINMNGHRISLISLEAITNEPAYIDSTIIDGNYVTTCITMINGEQDIIIRGFSLTRGKVGVAVLNHSQAMIINCYIYNNISYTGGGVMVYSSAAYFSGVIIHHNRGSMSGGGLYVGGISSITFDNANLCSIYSNTSGRGQDIFIHDIRSDVTAYLDTFTIQNPSTYFAQYYNSPSENYHLTLQYQHTVFQEINHDMYVSPDGDDTHDGLSPETALKTINTAIYRTASDSLNPKTVHLLPGVYSPSLNQQTLPICMKSWVSLVGAGTDSTLVHVEQNPIQLETNVSAIWFYFNEHCTISDFQITYASNITGSVIYGRQEKHLIIRNLIFDGLNLGDDNLIFIEHLENSQISNLDIRNITFNDGSIFRISSGFSGIIKDCIIMDCHSLGYEPTAWTSPLIWIDNYNAIEIQNCVFDNLVMADNDSQCIQIGDSNLTSPFNIDIINCQFTHIVGQPNAMIIASTGNPNIHITNSTFAGCSASNYALVTYGHVTITNSIFYNNIPYQFYIYPLDNGEHTNLTIDYSCIKNGQNSISNPGTGNTIHYQSTNVTFEPLFLGSDENDPLRYSLSNLSRCIDRGTPDTTGLSLPIMDLAGNYRIWNNRIDMGCYEYGSEPVGNVDEYLPAEVGGTLFNYPNPFNPNTTIRFQISHPSQCRLEIYNIRGQHVKTLVNERMAAGEHNVLWEGKDHTGQPCASGVYFYRLILDDKIVTKKMLMLK